VDALSLVVTVQCLACGSTYSKPAGAGTVNANPGCPQCGYLGWSGEGDVTDEVERPRFVAGLMQDRLAPQR
jgi:hypothetical protein